MTSQIKLCVEYLIQTDNVLILKSKVIDEFAMRFNDNSEVAYFLVHLVISLQMEERFSSWNHN